MTTSALAERTGLRVRNVYRYFRDRQAVMATLAERMNSRIESAIADIAGLSDPARSLEQVVDELVERVMMAGASEPAGVQVRAAMGTSRELQATTPHRIDASLICWQTLCDREEFALVPIGWRPAYSFS